MLLVHLACFVVAIPDQRVSWDSTNEILQQSQRTQCLIQHKSLTYDDQSQPNEKQIQNNKFCVHV